MGSAALQPEPLAIKISSKTADPPPSRESIREEAGSKRLRALHVDRQRHFCSRSAAEDEDVIIDILRYLINKGYEGEDLIAQYKNHEEEGRLRQGQSSTRKAERDIAEGRVGSSLREMQK